MTIEPTPAQPAFSWLAFIGGMFLAIFSGAFANIFSGLVGMSTGARPSAVLIGAIPGAIFALLSLRASRNGFGQGLLVGGCIIALIGGICGGMMVGN